MVLLYSSSRPRQFIHSYAKNLALQLPFVQSVMQLLLLIRFSQQLLCAISAGIPLSEGLSLMVQTNQQPEFNKIILQLQSRMRQGLPLHQAMAKHAIFPSLMIHMIRIGEESGQLELMLSKIAFLYHADVDRLLHRLTSLLEPLIMLVLGVLIGGLVVGMYLPIFNLGSLF